MSETLKTAVITGAAGGIGAATAHRLAADGWRLHLIDIDHGRLAALQADLPQTTTIAQSTLTGPHASAAALPHGADRIDALVHLAGIFTPHETGPEGQDIFTENMQHNAINAYDLAGAVEPRIAPGGRIVFTSSLAFNRGAPDYIGYTMAKGALVGLTRALSRKLGPQGVCVNAVAPGIIETPMTPDLIEARGRETLMANIPLGRFGQAEDVAGLIAFLLSRDGGYITGQLINVDGGVVNG